MSEPCDCQAGVLERLDRILDLLANRRKPSLAQETSGLYQRFQKGFISESEAKQRIADMTGIEIPSVEPAAAPTGHPYRVVLHGLHTKTITPLTKSGVSSQIYDRVRSRRHILKAMWRSLWRGRLNIVAEVQFVEAEPFDLAKGHTPDHYRNGWYVPGGLIS